MADVTTALLELTLPSPNLKYPSLLMPVLNIGTRSKFKQLNFTAEYTQQGVVAEVN
jgi:hypothetical protein